MKNKLLRSSSRLSLLGGIGVLSSTLAMACQDTEQRELGYTQADQDLRGREPAEPTEPFFGTPDEFVGRWVGRAEDPIALGDDDTYVFPSGSRQFVLDVSAGVDEFGSPHVSGTLTFGDAEPLPPPTDPEAGYPVGVSYKDLLSYGDDSFTGTNPDDRLPPFEGFTYNLGLLGATTSDVVALYDGVLSFVFSTAEPLDPWCQLQTPFEVPDAPGLHLCQETFGGQHEENPDGTGASCLLYSPNDASACPEDLTDPAFPDCLAFGEPVASANCDKLFLCMNNFCQCDAASCYAQPSEDELMLRREGNELVGAFAGTTFLNPRGLKTPLGEVRFERVD